NLHCLSLVSGVVYSVLAYRKIANYQKLINENFAYEDEISLQWLRFIIISLGGICLVATVVSVLQYVFEFDFGFNSDDSYENDRELWRKLYKAFIFNNNDLDVLLEDQSLYWNDDKEIVDTFVLKTIKRFDEKNGANQALLPEFKDDEDQEFARRLFRRTILNCDYYRHLISENTRNWDLDRVAFMDVVIMQCALAEILSFPNIPISVSLNEYVDIAKVYSTAKSGSFVNGTLDGIVNQLKKEGKLTKN
ncbi:transcription antitermination factor NusB, partial [Bacteroides heparinolyticus]|uniref:transcription antitermination factor NusB n=1 Tax=Prevotella heparinolytica TaxID=28113 RepID=UPI0035A19B2C